VAGFVVGERRDLEVNAVAVQELRSRLKAMTSARVVEEPPLRVVEEADVLKSHRYALIVKEHEAPLVVTIKVQVRNFGSVVLNPLTRYISV
jgi:hypothetical protein